MKQNPCPVVGEVTKPTGVGLDELDGAVESFCTGIADSVLAVVKQTGLVAAQHLDHLFDRLQSAAHCIVGPGIKEAFGRAFIAVAPELAEVFLDSPRSAGLEVELVQGPKRDRLSAAAIWVAFEPSPLTSSQGGVSLLGQAAMFLFAHRIDCLPKVFGDVKLVMHDVGLRQTLCGLAWWRPWGQPTLGPSSGPPRPPPAGLSMKGQLSSQSTASSVQEGVRTALCLSWHGQSI